MKSIKITMIIIMCMIIMITYSGCGKKNEETTNAQFNTDEKNPINNLKKDDYKNEKDNIVSENKKLDIKDNLSVEKEKINNEKIDEINKSDKDTTIVDVDSKKNESGFEKFSELDNTLLEWWFRRAVDNKPQRVSSETDCLLEKYDGIYLEDTDSKNIYLTMDEGYENGYTTKILDTLKENDVKITFFITGSYLDRNPELVKRMVEEGHIVGNHTVNHPKMPEIIDYNKLEEEILGLERDFKEMFNKNMTYLRPPTGAYSERTLAISKSLGYKTVFWSFAYADWDTSKQKGKEYAYETVMKELHNGEVMLLHAVSKDNTEALDDIIKSAKDLGYNFKTLDELEIKK